MKFKLLTALLIVAVCLQACTTKPPEAAPSGAVEVTWIDLQSVQNARQIGGYFTKSNRIIRQNAILRSGELALLSNEDKERLVNEYGLVSIIDLRDEIEAQNYPDPVMDGVRNHHLIVWPNEVRVQLIQESTTETGFDNELYIQNYYTTFALGSSAIEAYKKMFEILLKNETGSVLIHCVHGKDRTGVAVTLILSALSAEWDDIEQEYMLSENVDVASLRYYKSVIEER